MTPDCWCVAGVAIETTPRILLPDGMTVYSSTPMLSTTFDSKTCPVRADADWSGVLVRTIMTVPAGRTTRDWAEAVETATNANAVLSKAIRDRAKDI
jgi:hypothetical protein